MRALPALLVLALLSLVPASASANSTVCSFAPPEVTVDVTVSNDFAPSILRTDAGDILISDSDGTVDCGAATVRNTDTIVINKPTAVDGAFYDITYLSVRTPFTGGATDEPGSSDEIEFVVNFPAGGSLSIDPRFSTSDTGVPVDVALGGNQINLNANETDGVDADLTVNGPATVTVGSSVFDDRVIGSGGSGTPAAPFTNRIFTCGGLLGGNDTFVGGSADDDLCGLDGDDLVDGGAGDDHISGDLAVVPAATGNDTLIGGEGDDRIEGNAGDDQVDGGAGVDTVYGGDGNDSILFGSGNDTGSGDLGDDVLMGDVGKDRLSGGDGNDRLVGNAGKDKLRGDAGNDRHIGGPGADNCIGGPGADIFLSCESQSP